MDEEMCLSNFMRSNDDMADFDEFERKIDELSKILESSTCDDIEETSAQNSTEATKIVAANESLPSHGVSKDHLKKPQTRSAFNSKPSEKRETLSNLSSETMSQKAFMSVMEEDANRRYQEKVDRNRKSDQLKNEGNAAFRDGRLEKALMFYNEAIDLRKDSALLFTNRALVHLKLGLYSKACADCDASLKLKESLKPRLYKGKALHEMGHYEESVTWIQEAKSLHPKKKIIIEDYIAEWKSDQ